MPSYLPVTQHTKRVILTMHKLKNYFNKSGKEFGLRFLFLGGAIGCAAGTAAILFHKTIITFSQFLILPYLERVANFDWQPEVIIAIIAIPCIGGAIIALTTHYLSPEAEGHGVPEIMHAVVINEGIIKAKVGIVKFFSSAISISCGFSVGREGPTALIGATLGSWVGQVLHLGRKRMRLTVACGTAAGIAATFNAPLAGTAFALELVLGNLSLTYLSPIIFSSMLATFIARSISGNNHALFSEFQFILQSPWEILLYCFLGAVAGFVGVSYTKALDYVEGISEKIKLNLGVKAALGGLIVGVTLLFLPEVSGPLTWDTIRWFVEVPRGNWQSVLLIGITVAIAKILLTAISLGSGASGGVFAPALLIGGAIGAPYGLLVNHLFPQFADHPGGYALVCMGAVVAACTQAPLTAIVIIFELTNDYEIVLPLIMACSISLAIHNHLQKGSMYTIKLLRKGINLEWGRDIGVLQSLSVSDILKPELDAIPVSYKYHDILKKLRSAPRRTLPVIDVTGKLIGIISSASISNDDQNKIDNLTAKDLANKKVATIQPNQTLYEAFQIITNGDYSYLPVVSADNSGRLIGRMHRQELLQIYQNHLRLRGIY